MDVLDAGSSRADGSSLFGLLMIVVVMGVLGVTAVVSVSSLTGGGSSNIPVVHTATSGSSTPRASRSQTAGLGIAGITGHAEAAACQATAAGAASASTLYFATKGGVYPAKWSDLANVIAVDVLARDQRHDQRREPERARRARLENRHVGRGRDRTDVHVSLVPS